MDARIIKNGEVYNDGRRPRGIYPTLWLIASNGEIMVGAEIEKAGRVLKPVNHVKNGQWSNTDYELHGLAGDIFVRVQREFDGGIFPKANSIHDAQIEMEEFLKRNLDPSSFYAAMEKTFPRRTKELDALEAKIDVLEAKTGSDMEVVKVEIRKSYRKDTNPYGRLWVENKSYELTVDESTDNPELSGKLPKGCKILGWKQISSRKGAGVYEVEIAVPSDLRKEN